MHIDFLNRFCATEIKSESKFEFKFVRASQIIFYSYRLNQKAKVLDSLTFVSSWYLVEYK